MDFNSIITFVACIVFILIFGKIFILPLKSIIKLIFNSVLGGVLIYIINIIGSSFNFHIGRGSLRPFRDTFQGIHPLDNGAYGRSLRSYAVSAGGLAFINEFGNCSYGRSCYNHHI